ncbi:MAG: N-acetylmuramoyl-L-alanine amidase family protein [Campylobacterota bacterium]
MGYLKAVLKKDNEKKIEELRNLIKLGEKLNKDTTPDRKKLEILLERENVSLGKQINKVSKEKGYGKNPIQSIYTLENNIVINYTKKIEKSYVKRFFELKRDSSTKDVYDLEGNFIYAKDTKISIDGVDNIVIGQFKPYTLRVVIDNKKNLETSYFIDDKQVIITIDDLAIKNTPEKIVKKEKKPNKYIDTKNSIKTMYTDKNKIVVEFNKNISKNDIKSYRTYKKSGLYFDEFKIKGKFKYAMPIKLEINNLNRILVMQDDSNTLKIRISDEKDLKVIYILNKRSLIIKLLNLDTTTRRAASSKNKVVVIDPGHGGNDVGAVGSGKKYEKVVTLKVAKKLYNILKRRGYKVFLTRDKDNFIKVRNRTILANKKDANIFLSIHANAIAKSKAHKVKGIETFFLSPARSARAKRVAAKENSFDIRKMSSSSKQAFLESLNRPRITASHKLAIDVQAGLLQSISPHYKGVRDSGVREGPFWVLVGAQMPSILIEMGYISHPTEGKRLYSNRYQDYLAKGMANGIDSYFSKNP